MAKRIFLCTLVVMCLSQKGWSNSDPFEERVMVSLRMIGHELLLASGDSTSRVLPVTKENDRYKVQFASTFSFEPERLSVIADSIIDESQIASGYIIQMEDCDSGRVVYSYQINKKNEGNFIPCQGRSQPEGCYSLLLRIITPMMDIHAAETEHLAVEMDQRVSSSNILYWVSIGFVLGLFIVFKMKRKPSKKESHLLSIGSYLFDHKNMTLAKGSEKQDLTGKETDLLQLLYIHLNSTVHRDVILKEVWSDEGAYIGRTLDVYISKLRKKFEADPAINIINVRGVGYKMTLD